MFEETAAPASGENMVRCTTGVMIEPPSRTPESPPNLTDLELSQAESNLSVTHDCYSCDSMVLSRRPRYTNSHTSRIVTLLFADDLKVSLKSEKDLPAVLNALDNFSKENQLIIGVSKCATMGCENQYAINETAIPTPELYYYLGHPHRRMGIDWSMFASTTAKKMESSLNTVMFRSNHIHPLAKLYLFKIYVFSMYQYSLALLYLWSTLTPSYHPSQEVARFEEFERVQRRLNQNFNDAYEWNQHLKETNNHQCINAPDCDCCDKKIEYPATLAQLAYNRVSPRKRRYIDQLTNIQNKALSWVCGSTSSRAALRNFMTATPTIALQGYMSLIRYAARLSLLPKNNPLFLTKSICQMDTLGIFRMNSSKFAQQLLLIARSIIPSGESIQANKQQLWYHRRHHMTVANFIHATTSGDASFCRPAVLREPRRPWHRDSKETCLMPASAVTIAKTSFKMNALFNPGQTLMRACDTATRSNSGIDRVFYFPSSILTKLALKWRMDTLFVRKKCPLHLCDVKREHIRTCELVSDIVDDDSIVLQDPQYVFQQPPHYCVLDQLLNECTWDSIRLFAVIIGRLLTGHPSRDFRPAIT